MTLLAIAIASPLEALDDSFLSAHMVQHFLLMMAAPPLVAGGASICAFSARIAESLGEARAEAAVRLDANCGGRRAGCVRAAGRRCVVCVRHDFLAYPSLFELALASPFWHDIEHATFFWGGILFWWPMIESRRWPRWVSIPYLLFGDLINTGGFRFLCILRQSVVSKLCGGAREWF